MYFLKLKTGNYLGKLIHDFFILKNISFRLFEVLDECTDISDIEVVHESLDIIDKVMNTEYNP